MLLELLSCVRNQPSVSAPSYGIFQGEKENVIDWIDLNNPHFRDHLESHKHPKAELQEIKLKKVSREGVEKLRSALKQKADADKALEEAQAF